MKANELMIGDWYAFRGHPYKCTASDIASLAECEEKGAPTDISEIPLTAEIMERNFPGPEVIVWWPFLDGFHCEMQFGADMLVSGNFRYANQLQHALRLCWIDADIVI